MSFAARAADVARFATIDRIGRDAEGKLSGFQRPQVAAHIREIKDYLEQPDAILPNPIVVAFIDRVTISEEAPDGRCTLTIDVSDGAPGFVVDGQQRLTALGQTDKAFELFVSAVICADADELRRQFVLINNTRPLPKSLIYELLPGVANLPRRLANRSLAASLTARLNHDPRSSLHGLIHQHTNPTGIIRDTAIQRVIMISAGDGALRELYRRGGEDACFDLVSEFYRAVARVFSEAWEGHTPRTSRLVHGAGIAALGHVMDDLALLEGARTASDFEEGLQPLIGRTAWTSGRWDFGDGETRGWKDIQNLGRDIVKLAEFLADIVRNAAKARRAEPEASPLLKSAAE